jgi:hypothetical protein
MNLVTVLVTALVGLLSAVHLVPVVVGALGQFIGWRLKKASRARRSHIYHRVDGEEHILRRKYYKKGGKASAEEHARWARLKHLPVGADWNGIIGFFHPFW